MKQLTCPNCKHTWTPPRARAGRKPNPARVRIVCELAAAGKSFTQAGQAAKISKQAAHAIWTQYATPEQRARREASAAAVPRRASAPARPARS